jgi:hypothetical protein
VAPQRVNASARSDIPSFGAFGKPHPERVHQLETAVLYFPGFLGKGASHVGTARKLVIACLLVGSMGAVAHAAGALAVGACGAYSFAYDFPRETAANQAALQKCAGECKVVPVMRACGAIAIDGANACGPHGYAVARRLGQAQNSALKECYRFGGKECVIRAWACDAKD